MVVVTGLSTGISPSHYVQEWQDEFLALFPHRYDYIWADHTPPGVPVPWQTETRYPLSDRAIRQGTSLHGVRFGSETSYALLDIDAGSAYHPSRDAFAIPNLVQSLELLGLSSYIGITSSSSGGLHLYFPFDQPQSSWKIAIALTTTLEAAGYNVYPGQLEAFPNPKPYSPNGVPSLFNAHRLPLQIGSYLLNSDFQSIWTTQSEFLERWRFCRSQNVLDLNAIKKILKQVKHLAFPVTGKADKFINDLNTEIELGWTGPSQTNRLLGRITMREYVFRHVISGGDPQTGQKLVDAIVQVARSLPGYTQWCRHQHEIFQRAEEWAHCIENSHYFPYGSSHGKFQSKQNPVLDAAIKQAPSWNQQRSATTRDRIRYALIDLLEHSTLPAKATARFQALLGYGIGGGSLYRHRDLWHPTHLENQLVENQALEQTEEQTDQVSPDPSLDFQTCIYIEQPCDCVAASHGSSSTSLFPSDDGNPLHHNDPSDLNQQDKALQGGNDLRSAAVSTADAATGVQYVQQVLTHLQTWKHIRDAAAQNAQQHQRLIQQEAAATKRTVQMQQFLASGDPILVAEALAWAQINPGLLELSVRPFC
jgi:hypothetical protein